jgi:hypothetical protein
MIPSVVDFVGTIEDDGGGPALFYRHWWPVSTPGASIN